MPEFSGLKLRWAENGADYPDVIGVQIAKNPKGNPQKYSDQMRMEPVGTVGSGGNSGFQALNLAVQFGSRKIILIGFDMTDRSGVHWYGRNRWPMSNNPDQSNFRRWIAAFERSTQFLNEIGASVLNASPLSALPCFPKMSLTEALEFS